MSEFLIRLGNIEVPPAIVGGIATTDLVGDEIRTRLHEAKHEAATSVFGFDPGCALICQPRDGWAPGELSEAFGK